MRARNLKPGFFKNEELAECSLAARLCFSGLWLLADREGRLEDRPKRIKGELFAFDSIEVEPLLAELHRRCFILRYQASDGRGLIQILAFGKHQNPHHREPPSELPPPQSPGHGPHGNGIKPGASPPCNEREAPGKAEALTSRLDLARGSSRADSGIDESGTLIPEEATSHEVARHRPPDDDRPPLALVPQTPTAGPPDCPHLEILALWAEQLPQLPQHEAEQWKGARADHLRARWRETAASQRWESKADGLTYFGRFFAYVGKSRFLTGRVQPRDPNRKPFIATLAWIVKPENWAKTIEGEYHQDAA